jgi:succinate dehydrogenase/fumarate reductase flavoprotein subunit
MASGASHPKEMETDIVIVGYGGAGASAAIVAHDLGSQVIILEKTSTGGGNTRLGASSFFTPSKEKVAQAIDHIEKLCFGNTDRPVIEAYVNESVHNKEWIEKLGAVTSVTQFPLRNWPRVHRPPWPNIPGSEAMVNSHIGPLESSGHALWNLLESGVENRKIRVTTGTAAKELITNKNGEVIGVIADEQGKKISITAKKAVILTSGGFASNEALKELFLPYKPFFSAGHPGNTGDGIIMAQEVGAALWHMSVVKGSFGIKPKGIDSPFNMRLPTPKFIYVNKSGYRFTNETGWEFHLSYLALMYQDPLRQGYPQLPVFGILHKDNISGGPLDPGFNRLNYKWSRDNSAELAKGWIIEGQTVGELAKKLGVDEKNLEHSMNRYNGYCKLGMDPDFGRSEETLEPIDTPPYYAIELWPRLSNTLGGPKRDYKARVINTQGHPIPRLYSAGEMGSLFGFFYCGGGGVGEPLAVGRIAGRNAAAEKPWS